MVRMVDPNGEAFVWCRKCSGYVRCRLGWKLMNRCGPEKKDTKEPGDNVEKNSQARKKESYAKGWKVEGDRGVPEGRSVGD